MDTIKNFHDEWIKLLFDEYSKCSKEKVVNGFLSSFGNGDRSMRSGLPVFAIMQTFPKHKFQLRENQVLNRNSPCSICSSFYGFPEFIKDEEFWKLCFKTGGLIGHTLESYYMYMLLFNNQINISVPDEKSILIFNEIINIIQSTNPEDNLKKDVLQKIGKIKNFKSTKEERQYILETLGYCCILETDEHKGLLKGYTNLATAPSKTHSSDWNYPVDFWLGKNGINKYALDFWFGDHDVKLK